MYFTYFPKERCSLTWHYQSCSLFVPVFTAHSPTSAVWKLPLFPWATRDHCWGELGIHSREKQNHPFKQVSKLHTEEHSVLKTRPQLPPTTSATGPVGSSSAPSWQEIHPSAKSEFSSDRFGHWISSPRGPTKCHLLREEHREWSIPLVALSDQLISNLKTLPHTI